MKEREKENNEKSHLQILDQFENILPKSGVFLFDEILTAAIIIGGTVTLSGLYIINFAMQRQRKRILIKN